MLLFALHSQMIGFISFFSFSDAVMRYSKESVGFQTALSSLHIGQQFVFQSCLATSLIIATAAIKNGDLTPGDFVAVLSYTMNLFQPLNYLAKVYSQILTAVVDLQNLSELRALVPTIQDAPNARDLPPLSLLQPRSNELELNMDNAAIEFDNVKFTYPTQFDKMGLKGLSFTVQRGSKTAIVGATGAGKTTIGRLLLRFYDATEGTVRINGIDIKTVTQKSLRGMVGCVPQFPTMFNKSLKYNIMYGRQDASDDELETACKDAQLWDFIQNLPDGWDTIVGDRGLKLSGGEKQRAAIARCFLNQNPIVLLDEATSALDIVTESRVKDALDRKCGGRTSLVIAHRLGTICDADNIIVLDNGVVAEEVRTD